MSEADETARAAARRAREELAARQSEAPVLPASLVPPAVPDPLRYCIWATIALLAWLLTPAVLLVWFGGLGFARYLRAWRAGLRTTECWLRDPRWAMAYLGALALAGAGWAGWKLVRWVETIRL